MKQKQFIIPEQVRLIHKRESTNNQENTIHTFCQRKYDWAEVNWPSVCHAGDLPDWFLMENAVCPQHWDAQSDHDTFAQFLPSNAESYHFWGLLQNQFKLNVLFL